MSRLRDESVNHSHAGQMEAPMQHGQIFELKATGPDGQPLWAYRYRLDGRGSRRIQRGGCMGQGVRWSA